MTQQPDQITVSPNPPWKVLGMAIAVVGICIGAIVLVPLFAAIERFAPNGDDTVVVVEHSGERVETPIVGKTVKKVRLEETRTLVWTEKSKYPSRVPAVIDGGTLSAGDLRMQVLPEKIRISGLPGGPKDFDRNAVELELTP